MLKKYLFFSVLILLYCVFTKSLYWVTNLICYPPYLYPAHHQFSSVMEKFTENTRFCLICNYLSKIIPALQSRCTRFRFGPLSPEQMMPRLDYVIQQERCEWVSSVDVIIIIIIIVALLCLFLCEGDIYFLFHFKQYIFRTLSNIEES